MNNTSITLDKKEFKAIKTLIHKFSSSIETVLENDFSFLSVDERELHHSLLDMQDAWESEEIRDAMDAWVDIDR